MPQIISSNINQDIKYIKSKFKDCPDVIIKQASMADSTAAYFIYIDGMVNIDLIQRDFIGPILTLSSNDIPKNKLFNTLKSVDISVLNDMDNIIFEVLMGNTAFIADGISFAIICNLKKFEKRNISESQIEKNVRGPHESFIEAINTNMSILRRRIKNNNLKFKNFELGTVTHQKIIVAYIEGIANPEILNDLCNRIQSIKMDGILAAGYVEQAISDFPNSHIPQFLSTERSESAAAALLEGRFVVIVDGTPVVLIAPVTFFSFFQAEDDFSTNWMFGSFLRFVRFFSALIGMLLPSLYIAIVTYHYYVVPLSLVLPTAQARAKVPFPPIIEAIIMEIVIEMIREASIRLPTYINASIGIVGGITIGQAAVEAGIVSNVLIIVIATTTIASFLIPSYDMGLSIRFSRFIFMIFASILGAVGILSYGAYLFAHLVRLSSLGQPYFEPFTPFKLSDIKDTIIRFPIKYLKKRPDIAKPLNKKRG